MAIEYIDNTLPHQILREVGELLNGGRLEFKFQDNETGLVDHYRIVQFSDPAFWEPVDQEMVAKPIESFTVGEILYLDMITFKTKEFFPLARTRSIGITDTSEFRFRTKIFYPGEEYFIHDLRFVF